MKHLLLLVLLLGLSFGARAQVCNTTFETQAQVDAFATSGCSVVGGLFIRGGVRNPPPNTPPGVFDLSPLSRITAVTGSVGIVLNDLTSIQGLDNITSIGGELYVSGGTNLGTLDIFASLQSVGTTLIVSNNSSLTNISGFASLRSSQSIQISGNNRLVNITGFNLLLTTGIVSITACPALRAITGFTNLTALVPNPRFLTSELSISGNRSLETIQGFTSLATTDHLSITNNRSLQELAGFNSLRSVKSLNITTDSAMTSISGFNGPLVAENNISITGHARLLSITGFAGARATAAYINNNPRLLNLGGFAGSRIGNVSISSNAALRTVSGFTNSESVNNIQLDNNPKLTSIRGFGGSGTAPKTLLISGSDSLTTLTGAFAFGSYAALTSLYINSNPRLATCAESWICNYLARGGYSIITGNAATCTAPAIQAACRALGTEDARQALVAGYPNPVSSVYYLPTPAAYQVYDVLGKLLLQGTGATISVAGLPSGIYLLRTGAELKQSLRIVKQ